MRDSRETLRFLAAPTDVNRGGKVHGGIVMRRSGDPAAEDDPSLTTHCPTVFVALDRDGRAADAPTWPPVSAEDVVLDAHTRELVALRGSRPGTD